jgi:dTDP-4-dehydrorhamnose 3,5-epimerase
MKNQISDITTSAVSKIILSDGDIYHGLKSNDFGFTKFGEAYFSFIKYNKIKAWKKHTIMTSNLLVPIGSVKFVFYDYKKNIKEFIIGADNYVRLTVPPSIWFGFQGLSNGNNIILNIADVHHSDKEIEKKKISEIDYNWNFFK